MGGFALKRNRSFLWQAALILLPMAVLVIVGLFSLRQDRLLAQREAAERAHGIAEDLLPRLWAGLMPTNYPEQPGYHSFKVNGTGELQFPPPYASVPVPAPLDLQQLTQEQRRLWREAQKQEMEADGARARTEAIQSYQEFIATEPPENFSAAAHYALGLLLAAAGKKQGAADEFRLLLQKSPNAVAESGLPLKPLAQFQLIELALKTKNSVALTNELSPQKFFENIVLFPTLLTREFLNHAAEVGPPEQNELLKWRRLWQEHEFSRQLFFAASRRFDSDRLQGGTQDTTVAQTLVNLGAGATGPIWPLNSPYSPEVAFFWFNLPEKSAQSEDRTWLAIRSSKRTKNESLPALGTKADTASDSRNIWYLEAMQNIARLHPTNSPNESPALLARSNQPPADIWFICRSESEIRASLAAVFQQARGIPGYFGVGIEMAGKDYLYEKSGAVKERYLGSLATNFLASAYYKPTTGFQPDPDAANWVRSGTGYNPDAEPTLRANVYLINPSALFQRQRARTLWFGLVIAISAGTALFGLSTAWRAFDRQQRLSELKSNFVSSVSHELRAPIASVRLLAESLERGKVSTSQKQEEYFRFIGQECRRLSALVENVLDFSRIEQGRKQYEFEPTDLIALVRATVALMQTYAAEKGVTIALDLDGLPPSGFNLELCIDGRAIQQALVNLIDNALKHSPKGETVIVGIAASRERRVQSENMPISALPSALDTRHPSLVTLSVEDHGAGIPPEEHERIFERFYRLGPELRRETQGVGIGLSIVKHIAEAHGGRVLVRSAVGQGSRFTIELPHPTKDR